MTAFFLLMRRLRRIWDTRSLTFRIPCRAFLRDASKPNELLKDIDSIANRRRERSRHEHHRRSSSHWTGQPIYGGCSYIVTRATQPLELVCGTTGSVSFLFKIVSCGTNEETACSTTSQTTATLTWADVLERKRLLATEQRGSPSIAMCHSKEARCAASMKRKPSRGDVEQEGIPRAWQRAMEFLSTVNILTSCANKPYKLNQRPKPVRSLQPRLCDFVSLPGSSTLPIQAILQSRPITSLSNPQLHLRFLLDTPHAHSTRANFSLIRTIHQSRSLAPKNKQTNKQT